MAEKKKSGSIDDKIRVDIRRGRFLIGDLSHGNQGVYFEAGFAEGLGKKVIYVIDHQVWNDEQKRKQMVHFDTEHHTILRWSENDEKVMVEFKQDLQAMIRNEFPGEAT